MRAKPGGRCAAIWIALISFSLAEEPGQGNEPETFHVSVLVLNYDPLAGDGGQRLHSVCGWNDPRQLAEQYVADLRESSGGQVRYRVWQWRDLDEIPVKADGFRYTTESYLDCHHRRRPWHDKDAADYPRLLAEQGVTELMDRGVIDEVWLFGGPYFGYHEAAMAGPEAFYINGGVNDQIKSRRRFAVMGFNYERGVAEMLHSLCHRVEATMGREYGGWKAEELTTAWARFAANAHQSDGHAGVGSCHFPPNGEKGYDYSNPRQVLSTADDWLGYPELTGRKTVVTCESWGGPDYHRNYMNWWYARLPRVAGTGDDGRHLNWWKYVLNLNDE